MGRTKGTFGISSPRGNSFGNGGKLTTRSTTPSTKKKLTTKKPK